MFEINLTKHVYYYIGLKQNEILEIIYIFVNLREFT
jgi:hypothetical protein